MANVLSTDKQAGMIGALCEGSNMQIEVIDRQPYYWVGTTEDKK